MDALLSFFSVLKSEVNWLISLVLGSPDADQAQANAAHDAPSTEHIMFSHKGALPVQTVDASSDTTYHHAKDDQPQLPDKVADNPDDDIHPAFEAASDADAIQTHMGGSLFAFDVPVASDRIAHAPSAPIAITFAPLPAFGIPALAGDLSVHPLPNLGVSDDDVSPLVSFANGHSGGPSGGGGTGPSWTEYVTANVISNSNPGAEGLTFKLTFDQSQTYLQSQDADFQGAIEAVAKHLAQQFSNHATVSIDVGYNEVEGFKLGGALGESITYYTTVAGGYSALHAANGGAYGNLLDAAYGNLPPGQDPITGKHTYWVTTAEGRALGVSSSAPTYDGYIGITGGGKQDFNLTDILTKGAVASSNQYDGIGTIAHEFTEVMGRVMNFGAKSSGIPGYMPFDLFHFSSSQVGSHIYSGTAAGYFSLDGTWNPDTQLSTDTARSLNTNSGDHSDWASVSNGPADAYDASGGQGSVSPISHVDFLAMEAVGWHGGNFTGVWG